eukprot:GHVS01073538.1.p1 GENE.GHVS01073538.1~~GHVS01073538.1.p1  ORF type:complete len:808 (-),score=39.79 GHVS01073538.1:152-2575(-)
MVQTAGVEDAFVLSLRAIGTIMSLWSAGILLGVLPPRDPIVQGYSNRAFALVVVNLAVPMSAFVSLSTMVPSASLWELPLAGTLFLFLSYSIAYAIIRIGDCFNVFAVCTPSAVAMILVVCSWEATAFALALMRPVCSDRCSYVSTGMMSGADAAQADCVKKCELKFTGMIVLFFTPWRIAYPLTKLLYIKELKRRSVVRSPSLWIVRTRNMSKAVATIRGRLSTSITDKGWHRFARLRLPIHKKAMCPTAKKTSEKPPSVRTVRWRQDVVPGAKSVGWDVGHIVETHARRRSTHDSVMEYPVVEHDSKDGRTSVNSSRTSLFRLLSDKNAGEEFEREVDQLWTITHEVETPSGRNARTKSASGRTSSAQSRLATILKSQDDIRRSGENAEPGRVSAPSTLLKDGRDDFGPRRKTGQVPPDQLSEALTPQGSLSDGEQSGPGRLRETDIDPCTSAVVIELQPEASDMAAVSSYPRTTNTALVASGDRTKHEECETSPVSHGGSSAMLEPDVTPRIRPGEDDATAESRRYDRAQHECGGGSAPSCSSLEVNAGGRLHGTRTTNEYLWTSSTQELSNVPGEGSCISSRSSVDGAGHRMKRCWSSLWGSSRICQCLSFMRLFLSNTIIATVLGVCLLYWESLAALLFMPSGAFSWLGGVMKTWASLVVPLQGIITGSHLTRIFRSFYADVAPEEAVRRMPWIVIITVSLSRMVLLPTLGIVFVTSIIPLFVDKERLCVRSNGDPAALGLILTMALVCPPGNAVLVLSGFNPGDLHLFVLPCCLVAILFMLTWSVLSLDNVGYYNPVTACA